MWGLVFLGFVSPLAGESLPAGRIVEAVACSGDSTQTYALYVPSNYTPARPWPLIIAFDPRARGLNAVERYQKAAETYGYIVAGSNQSRNGSWESSQRSIQAMFADLPSRLAIDEKRVYTAGMSGGARVATQVALATGKIAGVIASSAALPDGRPRKSVPFVVFGTAGTEDFNYIEMKDLDRMLTSPHHVAIFEGGHVWLSSELAVEAVEWLEIQAMKSGLRTRDEALVARLFEKRSAAIEGKPDAEAYYATRTLAEDFAGLRDVSAVAAKAEQLRRAKSVKNALSKERDELQREREMLSQIYQAEAGLQAADRRGASLVELRSMLTRLSKQAKAETDSVDRRLARRVTRGVALGASERVKDGEYRAIFQELGLGGRPR